MHHPNNHLTAEQRFSVELDELLDRWASTDAISTAAICGLLDMQIRLLQDAAIDRAEGQQFFDGLEYDN